jgi:hypothetical protein
MPTETLTFGDVIESFEAETDKHEAALRANAMRIEIPHVETSQAETPTAKASKKKPTKKLRGIFERIAGSGVWWVRYADRTGKIHREKAGTREAAGTL